MSTASATRRRRAAACSFASSLVLSCVCACRASAGTEAESAERAAAARNHVAHPPEGTEVRLAGHGRRTALRAAKVLTASDEAPGWIDDAVVLVKDGRIEAVGP